MSLYADFNDPVGLERAWVTMGFLEIAAGDLEAAQAHFLSFLRAKQRSHSVRYILAEVVGTAVVHAHWRDKYSALVWTLAVLQNPGVDWETRQRAEKLCTELESKLRPNQIAAAQQQAAAQPFETLLATAVAA